MASDSVRIGFLADTHSRQEDGSDLPQQVLDAFAGVNQIVHLGDVGKEGILDRLRAIAPVSVPKRGKGEVIDAGGIKVGVTFDLTKLAVASAIDENGTPVLTDALPDALAKGFGSEVAVVAFGGTHRAHRSEASGVLWFNPGSPTLPSDRQDDNDLGSVAVLEVRDGKASVEVIRLTK